MKVKTQLKAGQATSTNRVTQTNTSDVRVTQSNDSSIG
jgi:hypothetical protein